MKLSSRFGLRAVTLSLLLVIASKDIYSQPINTYRIINVTFDTFSPTQLAINRGRLIWRDTDLSTNQYFLKYFSGQEIVRLDSNLLGVVADINGDYIAWNTSAEELKLFDVRTWITSVVGSTYNPDYGQRVSISNGRLAYAKRKITTGTEIHVYTVSPVHDTAFSAAVWNTEPMLSNGQLAWVASDSEQGSAASNIFFHDGMTTRNISNTTGARNRGPILKDAEIAWLQTVGTTTKVEVFTGDSIFTLAQPPNASTRIAGYDVSNGIVVAALLDTATNVSSIRIFNSETGAITALIDSDVVSSLHIDNGLVSWASGTGPNKISKTYRIQGGLLQSYGITDNPVVDDEEVAWTLGDAVEKRVFVTFERLTNNGRSGWPQTRFKDIDAGNVIWGDTTNSNHARLLYWNGTTTTRLTDSLIYQDFITLNDGYAIWRKDFTNLWLYDGTNAPRQIFDSLQCENMYVGGGSIGFFGFRLDAGNNINQAWLYKINTDSLIQLTNDASATFSNWIVMCDGNRAIWRRDSSNFGTLMYYNQGSTARLSDSTVQFEYSFRNGKVVWSERRSGIYQIMLYDVNSGMRTQVTNSSTNLVRPVTDGRFIVWFENPDYPFPPQNPVMWYYDITAGNAKKVSHSYFAFNSRWPWMSNGKIAWRQNNDIYIYDGSTISQLTEDGSAGGTSTTGSPIDVDEEIVLSEDQENIFTRTLQPRVAFDADHINGYAPLSVTFTSRSWQGTQTFSWNFGDGGSGTEVNPVHMYLNPGVYTVTLTVSGPTGAVSEKKIHLVRVTPSTSLHEKTPGIPKTFTLAQNYPNPFNPSTTINYELPATVHVSLKVFNLLGQEVATLVNEIKPAGIYQVRFDARDLASGLYIYRLIAGSYNSTKKFLLIK